VDTNFVLKENSGFMLSAHCVREKEKEKEGYHYFEVFNKGKYAHVSILFGDLRGVASRQ